MCVVAFKLKKKKQKNKEDKVRNVWSSNSPGLCVFPDFFLSKKALVPCADSRLRFCSSVHRSGWRGALRFPEALGGLKERNWIRARRFIASVVHILGTLV